MNYYPIENQVCTLVQARELAELLGDDAPDSLWMWSRPKEHHRQFMRHKDQQWQVSSARSIVSVVNDWIIYPAYTGDETGALLPDTIKNLPLPGPHEYLDDVLYFNLYKQIIRKISNFVCGYIWGDWDGSDNMIHEKQSEHEAHAKPDLLICLLKEKIIKPGELKYD